MVLEEILILENRASRKPTIIPACSASLQIRNWWQYLELSAFASEYSRNFSHLLRSTRRRKTHYLCPIRISQISDLT